MLLLVIAGHAMLETARDTLFLSELPAARLPWAYLTIAALALLVGRAVGARTSRRRRGRTLSIVLIGCALVDVAFWYGSADRDPASLFALYVWTGLAATLVTLRFWLLAGDVVDVGRAKRVFAIIGAGGLAGATLGAGAAGLVVLVAPPRTLILGSAALFVAAAVVNDVWSRRHGTRAAPEPARADGMPPPSLRGDAYLRRLLLVTLLATVVVTGVDFLFKSAVATHVPRAELAHFLARYHTLVNAGALGAQLVLAPRLLQRLGVVPALGLLPGLVALGTAASAVAGGFLPALLTKAVDGTMRHSLDRAGHEILHLPLADAVRERFRAVTTSLGQRGGQALASLGLLAATAAGASARQLAAGLAVLALGWLAALVVLRREYVARFRAQLRRLGGEIQSRLPRLDLRSLEMLLAAVSSDDDAEVVAALDVLEAYGKRDLVSPLLVLHPSRTVALRALALFGDATRPEVLRVVDRLLEHPDGEVRAAVLRLRTAHRPDEALLRRHLHDADSPAVRCTALLGLVAGGFVENEAAAAAALHDALADATAEACPALARALRDLPPRFARILASELSRHADARFAAAAARAIAADPSPVFLDTLLDLLARREARVAAREALVALGDPALERLALALDDPTTPPAVRLHVPRSVSRFAGPRAAAILVARLGRERDPRMRYKCLRGLGRMRTDDPRLPVDEAAICALADVEIARAVEILAARVTWQTVERAARAGGPPVLGALLAEAEGRAIEAVFRLLQILEPAAGYAIAYRGLAAGDATSRASGRELVENLLQGRRRTAVAALVDSLPPADRLAAALDEEALPDGAWVVGLAQDESPPTGGDAERLHAVARTLVDAVMRDAPEVVCEIARRELDAVAWPSGGPARAGGAHAG